MSVSRCLRCAFDAARPAKRINVQSIPVIQSRFYTDRRDTPAPKPAGRETIDVTPASQKVNEPVEQIQNAPPKRAQPAAVQTTPTGMARPDPSAVKEAASTPSTATTAAIASKQIKSSRAPIPPNVAAAYRTPFRHDFTHGIPVASLQLRSFSIRNLEFFADFAMRVAFYLKLPASGPVPLPKRIERWTVPRSNFVHKKSQENFERITLRRLVTVYDGHPDVVEIWLACLRKWQFYGVGMKANVWQFEGLDVVQKMDKQVAEIEKELEAKLANFGWHSSAAGKKSIEEMLRRQGNDIAGSPMSYIRDEIRDAKFIDLHRDVEGSG